MLDLAEQKDKLREFSDYKIRIGNSAVAIYQEVENKQKDIAIIYKEDGAYQLNLGIYNNIPSVNKVKFDEVVWEIRKKTKENENEIK